MKVLVLPISLHGPMKEISGCSGLRPMDIRSLPGILEHYGTLDSDAG